MSTRRWIGTLTAAAAAFVVVAAGCGGGSSAGSGGLGAAGVVPATAPILLSIDSNVSSDQWQTLDTLLKKFPARDRLVTQLRQSFEKDAKVSWATDVKPALGDEIDVAVLSLGQNGSNPQVVGLTQPKDEAKFDALVKKLNANDTSGSKTVTAKIDGWTVISDKQAAIDALTASGTKLSDEQSFKDATGKLGDTALLKVYANGAKLMDTLKSSLLTSALPTSALTTGGGKLDWISAELVAADNGTKLDGAMKTEGATTKVANYTSKLVDEIPAGALLVLDFDGSQLNSPEMQKQLQQGLSTLPPSYQGIGATIKQLLPIFGGENAIYVRAGSPIPEVTVVAQPQDPQQATKTIEQLLAQLTGGQLKGRPTTIGGIQATEVNLGRFSIYYAVVDGRLVVTTSQQGLADLKGGGAKLSSDATFQEAKDASGMPAATASFVYVNLKDSVPLLESLAQIAGANVPAEVTDNLRPLRTLTSYSTVDGDVTSFTMFLEVK